VFKAGGVSAIQESPLPPLIVHWAPQNCEAFGIAVCVPDPWRWDGGSSALLRRVGVENRGRYEPAILLTPHHVGMRTEVATDRFEFWQARAVDALLAR
jgi:hypothetical protein